MHRTLFACNNSALLEKRCSGCKKNKDERMFIDGKIIRSTCFNCRSNNKIHKKQSRNLSQLEDEKPLVEFEELTDELLIVIDQYIDLCDKENKENSNLCKLGFEFEITIN